MELAYRERLDGYRIMLGRNGREYSLPALPCLSVNGFCKETNTVYEFCECYWHGHTCQPYCDVAAGAPDTVAQRYERTMTRLEQITQAGYQVEVQWECDFDKGILSDHPEFKLHPVVQHSPLNNPDAFYGGRTEAMRFHRKAGIAVTIQYVDVVSLYPYVFKYFKFPVGHPVIHVGDSCQDIQTMLKKDFLIKCSILPPRQLYLPLPRFRCNKRLLSNRGLHVRNGCRKGVNRNVGTERDLTGREKWLHTCGGA